MKPSYFIFDLDDTLIYEIEYLKSAYREIAVLLKDDALYFQMYDWYQQGIDVFEEIANNYNISKIDLLHLYRIHVPSFDLNDGALHILELIKAKGHLLGLITDGRSITQRNKLKALGIESLFDHIVISGEFGSTKPNAKNYEAFLQTDILDYFYIGDNVKKDFVTPNKLGWTTICLLDKGYNIHPQLFDYPPDYLPRYKINNLLYLKRFI